MELERAASLAVVGMYGCLSLFTSLGMFAKRSEFIKKHAEKLKEWKEKGKSLEDRIVVNSQDGNLIVGAIQHGKVMINHKTLENFKEFKEKWRKFEKEASRFKWMTLIKSLIATTIGLVSVYLACWAFGFCQIPKSYEEKLFGWLLLGLVISPGILLSLFFSIEEIPSPGEFKVTVEANESNVHFPNEDDEDESGLSLAAAGVEPYRTYYYGYDTTVHDE